MTQYTLSHWGLYEVATDEGGARLLRPSPGDPDPSPIGLDQLSEEVDRLRILRPSVRAGFLDGAGGRHPERRGREPFVEVEWEEAIRLAAGELDRVIQRHGNEAIFGGSYGWASAGRFHHVQSQIHRFLNCIGGYVRHRDTYSHAAASVVLPHIVAPLNHLLEQHTSWEVMAEHTELFVAFGGVALKNAQVTAGGAMQHRVRQGLDRMRRNGTRFINVSPVKADLETGGDFEWLPIRPNTDTALMLGLAHTLLARGLHDAGFVATHCVGFEVVEAYLTGRRDGIVRDAAWASAITGIPAGRIERLAHEIAGARTMLNVAWSLQRAVHGEQPYWAVITLAALLGQIGLTGGGFGLGYGSMNSIGSSKLRFAGPTLEQGRNRVSAFIPVARIADMLEKPGEPFVYDGGRYTYPDIRLIYWAGGNPFHHHQDLNRLLKAWRRPETVIVHEQFWNPLARMADIVLPATTVLERNDIGYAVREGHLVAMKKAREPVGEARDDHAIFAELARAMNVGAAFTENRDERGWLRQLYEQVLDNAGDGIALPSFDDFWEQGFLDLGEAPEPIVLLRDFRADPARHPLPTPSGRIELHSETVAGFGHADCPGHAAWLEREDWLGAEKAARYPLHLLSHQPQRRLHSQLDHAAYSQAGKVAGREPVLINEGDAAARGIASRQVVRVFNERGSCLAGAVVTPEVASGTAVLATGAWLDPLSWQDDDALEKHGNPNVLTLDAGTSSLAQGCAAQSCLVEIEPWSEAPAVTAFDLPAFRRAEPASV